MEKMGLPEEISTPKLKPIKVRKPKTEEGTSESDIKLSDLLVYKNLDAGEIESIVEEQQRYEVQHNRLAGDWTSHWLDKYLDVKDRNKRSGANGEYVKVPSEKLAESLKFFEEHLKGNVLIDLGCGTSENMIKFAQKCGAQTYIGVDKQAFGSYGSLYNLLPKERLFNELNKDNPRYELNSEGKPMRVMLVSADMLDFVSHLKNESVCVTISGVDGYVIKADGYMEALCKEIARVIKKDGVVFGANADVLNDLAWQKDRTGEKRVWEKFEALEMPESKRGEEAIICIKGHIPLAPENIERLKLEWGPDLGPMSWRVAKTKATELNKKLRKGEKQWRLPTTDELLAKAKFDKAGSKTPFSFREDLYYWAKTDPESNNWTFSVNMDKGFIHGCGSTGNQTDGITINVRLVR